MNNTIKRRGRKRIDLTGRKFTRLTAIREEGRNKNGKILWLCQCDCGNKTKVTTGNLTRGNTKSCGCYEKIKAKEKIKKRMIGNTFGRLKVISLYDTVNETNIWECACSCGGKAKVRTTDLTRGHTKSCGCYQKERASEISKIDLTGKTFGRLTVIKLTGKSVRFSRSTKLTWLCKCECGNEVELFTSTLTSGNTRSCGCLAKEMAGEKSPSYNPNLTEEDRRKGRYAIGGYYADKWRKQVFEKDNYTCVICNQYGGQLNAHHLDGWNWCKEKRFDIENGVTLCENCHNEFHRIYGKGNNTKEQFEKYTNNYKKYKYEQLALF